MAHDRLPADLVMDDLIMRYIHIGLLAAISLLSSGCYSPSELIKQGPVFTGTTLKSPKQYALCVFPQWQEQRPDATLSETTSGYRLISANGLSASEVLQVDANVSGSSVALYRRAYADFGAGKHSLERSTQSCL